MLVHPKRGFKYCYTRAFDIVKVKSESIREFYFI